MRPQTAVVVRAIRLTPVASGHNADMPSNGSADRKEGTRWPS
jgi:hypothetical protein